MSEFDHDAAMKRDAERQEIVEEGLRIPYNFNQLIHTNSSTYELLIVIEILKKCSPPLLGSLISEDTPIIENMGSAVEKHFKDRSKSTEEYNQMMVALAKKIFDGATSSVGRYFSIWESRTFREKERARD